MFERLKQQYMASFEVKVRNLSQALEEHDLQALTTFVHQLAGSSGSYGFEDIAQKCGEIESMLVDQIELNSDSEQNIRQLIDLLSQHMDQ